MRYCRILFRTAIICQSELIEDRQIIIDGKNKNPAVLLMSFFDKTQNDINKKIKNINWKM